MPDHLLHELADDVRPLRPGFAKDVLAAARRRVRRRWSVAGAAALAALVAIAVPVAVGAGGSGRPGPAAGSRAILPSSADSATSRARSSTATPVATLSTSARRGGVYVAAVAWARAHSVAGTPPTRVLAVDAVCTGAASGETTGCTGRISPDVRAYVGLGHPAPAFRFVVILPPFPPSAAIDPTRLYVLLGPVDLRPTTATIWVEQLCGFDCVQGNQLVLTLHGGAWVVTGGRGMYIS